MRRLARLALAGVCIAAAVVVVPKRRASSVKRQPHRPVRHFLHCRVLERSTLLWALSAALTCLGYAASWFAPPWCFVLFGVSALGMLIPDGSIRRGHKSTKRRRVR